MDKAANGGNNAAKMHEEKLALEKSEHRTKKAGIKNQKKGKRKMETTNLKELRELRTQEKAIKARIDEVMPEAVKEAKDIQPQGGKFTVEGVGEFVLDVNPVLVKDPDNENDTAPDIFTSRDENAVNYRKKLKEQAGYKAQAAALTKTIKGCYEAFKSKFAHRATRFEYTLKCLNLE